ncbi:hypothetical protein OGAPHI_006187 [Ogataea philodendri]|uniref:Secreted protein n=1 Tax=Ogataea philodendri TaxID=1378263 RepID=A0A9P8NZA6_9ASCO|nr:uncharacterized protein OGAPHI_006187 [Ogataea philodendri]KAH3662006.1 hypothetical protein OGAPHI_006187 [Ogataea philodendri]
MYGSLRRIAHIVVMGPMRLIVFLVPIRAGVCRGPFQDSRNTPELGLVASEICYPHSNNVSDGQANSQNEPHEFQTCTPFEPWEVRVVFPVDEVKTDIADGPEEIEHNK